MNRLVMIQKTVRDQVLLWLGALAIVAILVTPAISATPDAANPLDRELISSDETSSTLRTLGGERATVLVFLNTECPISNGYISTLNAMSDQFRDQGITLIGLHPNAGVSLRDMANHRKEFGIKFPVYRDSGATLAQSFGVTHCPETVLLNPKGDIQYRGRIDERYSRRGGAAGEIKRRDLHLAVEEFLANRTVSVARTEAIGCPINQLKSNPLNGQQPAKKITGQEITYSGHIAGLLQKHCQSCHRPGGIGPFSLLTYPQAASWADDIQVFTENRQMPPWLPAEGFGEFHSKRTMSDQEITLIKKWVADGCLPGDLSQVPANPTFPEGWTLGEPDKVIQLEEPFTIPADGRDIYRCFVVPMDYDADQYVTGIEVRPGNTRVVHHVIVFIDTMGRSAQLDEQSPGPGYSTTAGFPGFLPAGSMGGWAPGNQPQALPAGMARVLPAKCRLVVQVHYHPSGKVEQDQTMIGLHFSKVPVTRTVRVIPVMPFGGQWSGMKIPAGDANYEVRTSFTVPKDCLALSVTPHMHLIGKDMRVTAVLPDGQEKPLIFVPRWDFNWQESYQYQEPVALPKGTKLNLVAHFDNSANNPTNPNTPPKEVRWGEQTSSEMCIAFVQVVSAEPAKTAKDLKAPTPGDLVKDAIFGRYQTTDRARSRLSRTKSESAE